MSCLPQTIPSKGLKHSCFNVNDVDLIPPPPPSDSAYQGIVPNLDGADGHSEHIIFGTNLDLTDDPAKTGAPDSNL